MADLIDRQAAIVQISKIIWDDAVAHDVKEVLKDLPSAQPQVCDDAISRDDAIMAVKTGALSAATIFGRTDEGATAYYETVKAIKALPPAQPERKKGKWERHYCEDGNPDGWRCDKCDEWYYFGQTLPNFCPNCGARMQEGEENG